jgi:DNA-directed RNA polymerase sigma subunit (sigma70/sigma32)
MLRLPPRGARWRREEDEEPVAAVRAGADLAVIAEQHGRTRRLAAAAVAAVPDEGDREVLERRLGLSGGGPQTLAQIGAHLGISREGVRQRADRAVKAIASARARTGYRAAGEGAGLGVRAHQRR